jgi:hypothetical protein
MPVATGSFRLPSDVEGYGSERTWTSLYALACTVPQDHCIVELGVYKGQGLICLAQSGRECYGVDHFKGEAGGTKHGATFGFFDHFAGSYRRALDEALERYGVAGNVHIIEGNSQLQETADTFLEMQAAIGKRQPIGMLVIDAAHDYESVKRDFVTWCDLVGKDGFILFDDAQYDEIAQFITELPDHGWECVGYSAGGRLAGAYRKEDV